MNYFLAHRFYILNEIRDFTEANIYKGQKDSALLVLMYHVLEPPLTPSSQCIYTHGVFSPSFVLRFVFVKYILINCRIYCPRK